MNTKERIEKLAEFRKFIINATQKDIEEHLEGYLRHYLDPVIDDLTWENIESTKSNNDYDDRDIYGEVSR